MHTEDEILILNSAQNKYILGSDKWVQASVQAVETIASSGGCLICSTNPQTWDFTTYLAGKFNIRTIMIVKSQNDEKGIEDLRETLSQFALNPELVTPLFLDEKVKGNPKSFWPIRDRFAADIAKFIYPVSIKPGGKLDTILAEGKNAAKIRNDFSIKYIHETHTKPEWNNLINSNYSINKLPPGEWLFHWTRASQGPWPGEKSCTFFRDMLETPGRYVRSAADTLARILTEGKILGSAWKIAAKTGVVAFTESLPTEALKLMRWRKRFVMFSFEPYGIAIRKDAAIALGAKKVSYLEQNSKSNDSGIFTHPKGEKTDWSLEKEWRIPGDIDLSVLDSKDYFAIVPTFNENDFISLNQEKLQINIYHLFD